MRSLLLVSCLILGISPFASAQPNFQATKFDEFGDEYPTNAAARLDNFAIQLQNQPTTNGFIIGYRSFRDLPGITGRHLNWMRSYLINSRGIPPERIKVIDGGQASCLILEFWVVPVGTVPAPREGAYSRGFHDLGVARKFDEYFYTATEDLVSYGTEYEDGLEGFADALRKEPRSFAYIIGYEQYELQTKGKRKGRRIRVDPPGTALREMASKKSELFKSFGISPARVKLVNGGYRNVRALELWIVPRGALAPRPTPNMLPYRAPAR